MGLKKQIGFSGDVDEYFNDLTFVENIDPFFFATHIDVASPDTNLWLNNEIECERGAPSTGDDDHAYEKVGLVMFSLGRQIPFVTSIERIRFKFYKKILGIRTLLVGESSEKDWQVNEVTFNQRYGDDLDNSATNGRLVNFISQWAKGKWDSDVANFLPWGWMPDGEGYINQVVLPNAVGYTDIIDMLHKGIVNRNLAFETVYSLSVLMDTPSANTQFDARDVVNKPKFNIATICEEPPSLTNFRVSPHPDFPHIAVFEWDAYNDESFLEFNLTQDNLLNVPARFTRVEEALGSRLLWAGSDIGLRKVHVNLSPEGSNGVGAEKYEDYDSTVLDPQYPTIYPDSTFSLYILAVGKDIITSYVPIGAWTKVSSGWNLDLYSSDALTVRIEIPVLDTGNTQVIGAPVQAVGNVIPLQVQTLNSRVMKAIEVDWGDGNITRTVYDNPTDVEVIDHIYGRAGSYDINVRAYSDDGFADRFYEAETAFVINDLSSIAILNMSPTHFKTGDKVVMSGRQSYNIADNVTITKYEFSMNYDAGVPSWKDNGTDPLLIVDTSSPPVGIVIGTEAAVRITDSNVVTDIDDTPFTIITGTGTTISNPSDIGLAPRTVITRRVGGRERKKTIAKTTGGEDVEIDAGISREIMTYNCMSERDAVNEDLVIMENHIDNDNFVKVITRDVPGQELEVIGKILQFTDTHPHDEYMTWEFSIRVYQKTSTPI